MACVDSSGLMVLHRSAGIDRGWLIRAGRDANCANQPLGLVAANDRSADRSRRSPNDC